jgi:hypothetical protein
MTEESRDAADGATVDKTQKEDRPSEGGQDGGAAGDGPRTTSGSREVAREPGFMRNKSEREKGPDYGRSRVWQQDI